MDNRKIHTSRGTVELRRVPAAAHRSRTRRRLVTRGLTGFAFAAAEAMVTACGMLLVGVFSSWK
jgi:hypothetical protein